MGNHLCRDATTVNTAPTTTPATLVVHIAPPTVSPVQMLVHDVLCNLFDYLRVKDVGRAGLVQMQWALAGKQRLPSANEALRVPQDVLRVGLAVRVFSKYFHTKHWSHVGLGPGLFYLEKTKIGNRFEFVESDNPYTGCRPIYRRQLILATSGVTIVGTLDPVTHRPVTQLEGQIRIKQAKNIFVRYVNAPHVLFVRRVVHVV